LQRQILPAFDRGIAAPLKNNAPATIPLEATNVTTPHHQHYLIKCNILADGGSYSNAQLAQEYRLCYDENQHTIMAAYDQPPT